MFKYRQVPARMRLGDTDRAVAGAGRTGRRKAAQLRRGAEAALCDVRGRDDHPRPLRYESPSLRYGSLPTGVPGPEKQTDVGTPRYREISVLLPLRQPFVVPGAYHRVPEPRHRARTCDRA